MVEFGLAIGMPEGVEPPAAKGEVAKGEGEAARRALAGGGGSFALVFDTLRVDLADLVDLTDLAVMADLAERTLGVGLWLLTLSRDAPREEEAPRGLLADLRSAAAETALTAPLSLVVPAPLALLDDDRVGLVTVTTFLEVPFVPTGESDGGGSVGQRVRKLLLLTPNPYQARNSSLNAFSSL